MPALHSTDFSATHSLQQMFLLIRMHGFMNHGGLQPLIATHATNKGPAEVVRDDDDGVPSAGKRPGSSLIRASVDMLRPYPRLARGCFYLSGQCGRSLMMMLTRSLGRLDAPRFPLLITSCALPYLH